MGLRNLDSQMGDDSVVVEDEVDPVATVFVAKSEQKNVLVEEFDREGHEFRSCLTCGGN